MYEELINSARENANANNQWSADQAQKQMDFQTISNAKAMRFSAEENEKNRVFQKEMSNTSHQREVADLIKAGLNPVLSSKYGGASTPTGNSAQGVSSQGSKGETDTSVTGLFGQMINALINQASAIQTTAMNNQTQVQTTGMNNQTQIETTRMMNEVAQKVATIGASAMLGTANINARTNLTMQGQQQAFEEYLKKKYPQTAYGTVASLSNSFGEFLKVIGNGKSFGENIKAWIKYRQTGNRGGSW